MLPNVKSVRIAESGLYVLGLGLAAYWSAMVAVWAPTRCWPLTIVLVWIPIAVGCLISSVLAPARWKVVAAFHVACVGLAAMLIPWHPRQVFVRNLESLTGKSVAEVRAIMRPYMANEPTQLSGDLYVPEELRPSRPTLLLSYRWNDTDGAFDADVGEVFFRDGRVVGTRFDAD
jgi:hypothetical protein